MTTRILPKAQGISQILFHNKTIFAIKVMDIHDKRRLIPWNSISQFLEAEYNECPAKTHVLLNNGNKISLKCDVDEIYNDVAILLEGIDSPVPA